MPDFWTNNLAALRSANPDLAGRLERLAPSELLTLEPSRSGPAAPTARAAGPDGVLRYLHSKYDPQREAAALVQANLRPDALCYVLFGCGLGYAPAELLARLPADAVVVVVEPDPIILATALRLHDFAVALILRRLTLITAAEPAHLHQQLQPLDLKIFAGLQLFSWPAAEQLAGPFFARVRQGITDYVAYARTGLAMLLLKNELTVSNIAHNLGRYAATPSLGIIRQRFAGFPAVVVSAGPSLHSRLAELRTLADRAVIIAVQTALRPLLEAGIRPHFVTSLDYDEIGRRFFQDLPADQLAGIHLVAEPKAHWKVIDEFAGAAEGTQSRSDPLSRPSPQVEGIAPMISFLGNEIADQLLDCPPAGHDRLPAGATVAHLAFYLAQHLGCDPIVFVGQDLGFSNGCYYTPGTAIHRLWTGELNRFNSVESMEWQRIVRNRGELRKMTDVFGRPIYTDEQMWLYLTQFERDFAGAKQRIIDATGGGVRKAGAEIMDLAEVARQFATRPLPPDAWAYRRQTRWSDPARLTDAAAAIDRRIEQIGQLEKVCKETLALLARLGELLGRDQAEFDRTMARVDRQRDWVRRHQAVLDLVGYVAQIAEYNRLTADLALRVQGAQGDEKTRLQLARDQAYVSAIRDACGRLLATLTAARQRLGPQNSECGIRNSELKNSTSNDSSESEVPNSEFRIPNC